MCVTSAPQLATEGTYLNHNISVHSVTGNQCRVVICLSDHCCNTQDLGHFFYILKLETQTGNSTLSCTLHECRLLNIRYIKAVLIMNRFEGKGLAGAIQLTGWSNNVKDTK